MTKLLHGDCFEFMENTADDFFDIIITSPPYNRKRNDKYKNHKDILLDYHGMLSKLIDECLRVCSGHIFLNLQKNYYNKIDVHRIMGDYSDMIVENIIWNKDNPMPSPAFNITNSYEYILVLQKQSRPLKATSTYTKNHFSTPVYSNNPYKKIHRAVMHPDACEYLVSNFCKIGQKVYDPFFGVGTTGVVAKKYGLDVYGSELDREYFEISKQRLSEIKEYQQELFND